MQLGMIGLGRMGANMARRLMKNGHTIVVVTHEENIARNARRIVRLRDGRIESDEESG